MFNYVSNSLFEIFSGARFPGAKSPRVAGLEGCYVGLV